MTRSVSLPYLLLFLTPIVSAPALAGDVIHEREQGFKAAKRAVATLRSSLEEGRLQAMEAPAATLAEIAGHLPDWFPPGSKGGFFSGARGAIWENFADFTRLAREFQADTQTLAQLAAAPKPEAAALTTALGRVREDCQNCHRLYKRGG